MLGQRGLENIQGASKLCKHECLRSQGEGQQTAQCEGQQTAQSDNKQHIEEKHQIEVGRTPQSISVFLVV